MTAGSFDTVFRRAARTALVKRREAESGDGRHGSRRNLKAAAADTSSAEQRDMGPPPEHIAMRQTFGLLG